MSSFAPVQQPMFGEYSPFSNVFAQSMAQPPLATGSPLGQGMTGMADLSGLIGVTDPGMKFVLNGILSSVLTSSLGNNFVPANFSPGVNMYSQMKARDLAGGFRSTVGKVAESDQRAVFEMLRGMARITGSEFGAREQEAARSFASSASGFLPYIAGAAPDMLDRLAGTTGSATVMAQNMFMGGRYATDPITGRRGITPESSAAMTTRVFENLYGPGKDLSEMGGIRAGQAGALYDEMQRRGMMGSAQPRAQALEKIAKDMNITVAEATALPELDTKIRELDADRVSEKLKDMSKAVSAMKEVFGEMGQPDAPMQQLVGAIESLTQANIPSMEPAKIERMIRDTSNTAKAVGIDMPTTFRLMGSTAAMADRAGVDRIFAPEITLQAMRENDATKRMFGGARAFGLASSDKLMNIQQQLGVEANKDFRTQQFASVARLVDQYKFKPKEGSDLAKVYDAITGKRAITEEDRKLLVGINQSPGGMAAFLKKEGVSAAVIQDLAANQAANAEYMHKYNIGGRVGKTLQAERAIKEMTNFGGFVISRYAQDETGLEGTSANLKTELTKNAGELSQVAARALMSASKEELDKPEEVVRKALEAQLKSKGVTNLNDKDKALINSMSAGLADNAKSYAKRAGFQYLTNMQATLSPRILKEAAVTGAQISQESEFQETLRGFGKTDITQRLADLVRNAGPNTTFKEGAAAILGFQNKGDLREVLGPEIDAMEKASKQFATFDANKVEEAYLRDASVNNRLKSEQANISAEEKEKLNTERESIKDRLIASGQATKENVETKFKEFSDFKAFEGYKGMDAQKALAKSQENLDNFKEIHGVSKEDVQMMRGRDLLFKGRENALADFKRITESSGMQLLDKFGAVTPGNTRFRELNEAYNQLTSTKREDLKYGVEALGRFTDIYGKNAGMMQAGGVKGSEIVDSTKSITGFINKIADATGTSMDDVLEGKVKEGAFDLNYLKAIRQEDINAIKELTETGKAQSSAAREKLKGKLKGLNEAAEKEKNPAEQIKLKERAKEIDKIINSDATQLQATRDAAESTVNNLSDNSVKAIRDEFKEFERSTKEQTTQNKALDDLLANLSKTTKTTITRENVDKYVVKSALSKDEKASLFAKDKDGKTLIDKEAKIGSKDQETLQDLRKNSLSQDMSKKLLGYKDKDDKSLTNEQKEEKRKLLEEAGVKTVAEFEEKQKAKEAAISDISKRSNITVEELRKIDEINIKAKTKNLKEAEQNEKFVDSFRGKLSEKDKQNLDSILAATDKANNDVSNSIKNLGKFDTDALRATIGAQGLGKIAVAGLGSLLESTKILGKQLVSPTGPKMSEDTIKNRVAASRLMESHPEVASKYLESIGIDKAKTKGVSESAVKRVAGELNFAANEAARMSGLGVGASEQDKLKAVKDLLSQDREKIKSREQQSLRDQLVDSGITKDMFMGGEKGADVTFRESALKDKFRQTEKKISEGALKSKPGDPGRQVVEAVFPKDAKLTVNGKLDFNGRVEASATVMPNTSNA